jgi:hypothetical protein
MPAMDWFPDEPEVPDSDRVQGRCGLRYEDVSQEGQLLALSTTHAMGEVVWRQLLANHPLTSGPRSGVLPILSRLVVEVGGGPISVAAQLEVDARIALAHGTPDHDHATVDRIYLNMWMRLFGLVGRTNAPRPSDAGARVQVGHVFIEHVLTRPFAAPAERKVLALDVPGLPSVPPTRWPLRGPADVLAPPADARVVDAALLADDAEISFGYNHTDSNRHVNSLVYPRLFLDAALRRFSVHGWDTRRHARRFEVAFRKPCFAGHRARIALGALERPGELGAVGAFISDEAPLGRPHCTLQMWFK